MTEDNRREDLLNALRRLADALGRTPARAQMQEHGDYSYGPYYDEFGSWNAALEAAGLALNERAEVPKADIREDLQRVANELGRAPTADEYRGHGTYSPDVAIRHWGSWLDARSAAGLNGTKISPGKRVDRDDLIEELQRLTLELGRPPTQSDINSDAKYSQRPYYREFGSLNAALEAAGIETR